VRVEGGYFKTDNGLFRIAHSPNDGAWLGNDHSLRKVNKDWCDSKAVHVVGFYPIMVTVGSREKRILAHEHNKKNATIEVIGTIPIFKVKTIQRMYNHIERLSYCTESELLELYSQERIEIDIIEYIHQTPKQIDSFKNKLDELKKTQQLEAEQKRLDNARQYEEYQKRIEVARIENEKKAESKYNDGDKISFDEYEKLNNPFAYDDISRLEDDRRIGGYAEYFECIITFTNDRHIKVYVKNKMPLW
jgi:hypothetical protein